MVGVPYSDAMIENAYNDAMAQAHPDSDAAGLTERYGDKVIQRAFDGDPNLTSDLDALVAYLQVLGTMADIKDYELKQQAEAK